MEYELRPFWRKIFDFDWKFGLFLVLIICIPRFMLVLHVNATGNYSSIGLVMLISAIAPFIFLSSYGRKKIGLTTTRRYKILLAAFIVGLASSFLLYFLGKMLYGNSYENWYHYIGKSYNIAPGINPHDKAILFTIVVTTGITFSPVGEELFFRGIIHSSFAKSFGSKKASVIDGAAFALAHISHFGLVFINNKWNFFAMPALIWVSAMFLLSLMFFFFKQRSRSILGAIICHAAFSLGMIYSIFYLL